VAAVALQSLNPKWPPPFLFCWLVFFPIEPHTTRVIKFLFKMKKKEKKRQWRKSRLAEVFLDYE
jgi:hypothetical protein